jgi:hypothetical protein
METKTHSSGDPAQQRREMRYQNIVASIERCQRKLEKADKTVGRMVRTIAKLERQRKRLADQIEKAKPLSYADQMAPAKSEPAIETDHLSEPEFVKLAEAADKVVKKAEARMKRKAKPTETTDISMAELNMAPGVFDKPMQENEFGNKLTSALRTELQDANDRLAAAFNDSMAGKGPFTAVGGKVTDQEVIAEMKKKARRERRARDRVMKTRR